MYAGPASSSSTALAPVPVVQLRRNKGPLPSWARKEPGRNVLQSVTIARQIMIMRVDPEFADNCIPLQRCDAGPSCGDGNELVDGCSVGKLELLQLQLDELLGCVDPGLYLDGVYPAAQILRNPQDCDGPLRRQSGLVDARCPTPVECFVPFNRHRLLLLK